MLSLNTELKMLSQGYGTIGSIDEAGRGPLAGPVVAACIMINKDTIRHISKIKALKEVKDSKKLNEKKRDALFKIINENFQFGVGVRDNYEIDQINILEATLLAMEDATASLNIKPELLLIDGNKKIKNLAIPQNTIIKGDSKVFSIAAASIVAKVMRDRIMAELSEKYPQYDFYQNKGYGTKHHLECIKKFGPSPIHRKSFEPIKSLLLERKYHII